MNTILHNDKNYRVYAYKKEAEFEKDVVRYADRIFGSDSVYFDLKKKMKNKKIGTIPDGYVVDFTFAEKPRLYIVENELVVHDPFRHIGEQILKFAVTYKESGRKIKSFLLDHIMADDSRRDFFETKVKDTPYRNVDDLLESIIFEEEVMAVVIIDERTDDLDNVLSQLTMKTDVIEFRKFMCGDDEMFLFSPFHEEIRDIQESKSALRPSELDTIVVPARKEGFEAVFLEEACWYAIRIGAAMIEKIKYIAAYQVAPESAITHVAKVSAIEKYKDSGKYIVHFEGVASQLSQTIKLDDKASAPQAPRYTSFERINKAKKLSDVF
jgi:hypothetical protein